MNEIVKKYAKIENKTFMTVDEAVELSSELAERALKTDIQFDGVVGIANGARLMTTIIAKNLGVSYQMLTIRRQGSLVKNYLGRFSFVVRFFSTWYSTPVLNYPLIKVINNMGKLKIENVKGNEGGFKGKKNILIVDDALDFGSTIQAAKQIIKKENKECKTVVAVISWAHLKPHKKQVTGPDIFISRKIQHFPWSLNNPHYKEYEHWLEMHDARVSKFGE